MKLVEYTTAKQTTVKQLSTCDQAKSTSFTVSVFAEIKGGEGVLYRLNCITEIVWSV